MESKFSNSKSNCNSDYKLNFLSEHLKDPKYKTEMCKNFVKYGKCSYKKKCRYAHGDPELISKNVSNKNYKRIKCNNFHSKPGVCPYGKRCQYIHEDRKLEDTELVRFNFYQTLIKKKEYEKFMYINNEIIPRQCLSKQDQQLEIDFNKQLNKNCSRLPIFSEITEYSITNPNTKLLPKDATQTKENFDYSHKRSDNCSTNSNSIEEVPDYYYNKNNNCYDYVKFTNQKGMEFNNLDYKHNKVKQQNDNNNINKNNDSKKNLEIKFSLFKKQKL